MLIWFLIILGVIWLSFATISDFKSHEIPNWIWLSLIAFCLGARFFYGLFEVGGYMHLYQGLIWLVIFFFIANGFYYSRLFAMGDAKLMMSLGVLLPFSESFFQNVYAAIYFVVIFLMVGSLYGIVASMYLIFGNFKAFKKEFIFQVKKNKNLIGTMILASLIVGLLAMGSISLMVFAGLILVIPFLYFYAKAIDESCMVKKVKPSKLTIGDWLYEDVKVGSKVIKASWDGLGEEDIKLLKKKNKQVLIRRGISFGVTFLISFIIYALFYFRGFF